MSEKNPAPSESHYITTRTRDEAIRIKNRLHLQPGQTARIEEIGPEEFEVLITDV